MDSFLARYRSSTTDLPRFFGKDASECQHFIRCLRRKAFDENRVGDYTWMARVSYPCFVDQALGWRASLDHETQNDWKLLEIALLRQYAPSESDNEEESGTIATLAAPPIPRMRTPTPEPTPPATAILPPFIALDTGIIGLRAGRIKVVGYPEDRYISQSKSKQGHYWIVATAARALQVYLPAVASSTEAFDIKLANGDLLGFQWRRRKVKPASWGKLVSLTTTTVGQSVVPIASSSTNCDGDFTGTMWKLAADNTLETSAKFASGARVSLVAALNTENQLFFTRDWSGYVEGHATDFQGRLVFEPI